jgi:DNA-binding LytR/AlgR family response regulator
VIELEDLAMTVYKVDPNGEKIFTVINLDHVDFIENDGKRAVFHMEDEKYFLITNKAELEECLSTRGFDALDRANLVNIKRIRAFDREYGKVFFKEQPNNSAKYATVARIKYSFVEKLIHLAIAKHKNTQVEGHHNKNLISSLTTRLKEIF